MRNKILLLATVFLTQHIILLGQRNENRLFISIACYEKDLTKDRITFIVEIANYDTASVIIPNSIISGPFKSLQVNVGFELERIHNGDTTDVLLTRNEDINAPGLSPNNDFTLEAGSTRLIKIEIDNMYFDRPGIYMIRFGLKKRSLFQKKLKFKSDIFSNWKIIHND